MTPMLVYRTRLDQAWNAVPAPVRHLLILLVALLAAAAVDAYAGGARDWRTFASAFAAVFFTRWLPRLVVLLFAAAGEPAPPRG